MASYKPLPCQIGLTYYRMFFKKSHQGVFILKSVIPKRLNFPKRSPIRECSFVSTKTFSNGTSNLFGIYPLCKSLWVIIKTFSYGTCKSLWEISFVQVSLGWRFPVWTLLDGTIPKTLPDGTPCLFGVSIFKHILLGLIHINTP